MEFAPDITPRLVGAAVTADTTRVVGGWADGLITVNQPLDQLRAVFDAFRAGGGDGKPIFLQVHLSWDEDEAVALAVAHDQWKSNVFASPLAWNLDSRQFDEAAGFVEPDDVRSAVLISYRVERHLEWLREYVALGVDGLYLHHVGQTRPRSSMCSRRRSYPSSGEAMSTVRTSDLWWKNAVVYCLDVETFLDWDGDGRGDFAGLTEHVDYLAGIGVSCLWLMPFYPSPNRDDGYDITDYYTVDARLGSLGDWFALIRTAKDRGMRVIVDLVVNHTSDRHPWFRASRSSKNNRFRDYYVWVDEPPPEPKPQVVFPDAEDSIWTKDRRTGQWYLHHFYSHQPDLNIANPEVRDEIAKIAGFWVELGVDGFRVDGCRSSSRWAPPSPWVTWPSILMRRCVTSARSWRAAVATRCCSAK